MKRFIIAIIITLCFSIPAFSITMQEAEKMIQTFLERGSYIRIDASYYDVPYNMIAYTSTKPPEHEYYVRNAILYISKSGGLTLTLQKEATFDGRDALCIQYVSSSLIFGFYGLWACDMTVDKNGNLILKQKQLTVDKNGNLMLKEKE